MRSGKNTLAVSVAIWFLLLGFAYFSLLAYSTERGEQVKTQNTDWPAASHLEKDRDKFTLVTFIHPHCPCSRSSLNELCKIMSRAHKNINCQVVFLKPDELGAGWEKTDLWQTANTIPGAKCLVDKNGAEAQNFSARTSGQTFLFDNKGKLVYSGGITGSRGHEGDNPGQLAIEDLAMSKKSKNSCSPVFGCPLFDNESKVKSGSIEVARN